MSSSPPAGKKAIKRFVLTFQDELVERIGWLIRIRWLAAAGVSTTILLVDLLFDLLLNYRILLVCAAFIFLYNLIFHFYFRCLLREEHLPQRHQRTSRFANIQISTDLVLLIVLIYFSGGAENPFIFYFIFHVIIASILLSNLASYLQASLAVVLFNLMLVLDYLQVIPHYRLFPFLNESVYHNPVFLLGVAGVFTSTLYLSVYMATSITSKLRRREEELMQLKDSLEQTNRRLMEIYEYRSRFILKVEHELKAPLAAIQSLITAVITGFPEHPEPKVKDLLTRAEHRTHNLLELIRQLLTLSRMQTAGHAFKLEPVKLEPIISRQLEILHAQAESKGLEIVLDLPAEIPPVKADQEAMHQVVMNLLSNAVKYTEQGSVTFKVSAEGNFIRLDVVDTGIGMSKEEVAMVFEEFYRTSDAKAKYEGTGLGLSIVWEIIEGHGGRIEVVSEPGRGTTFTVWLPRAEA
ncbi:MAG: HAMP domain-containing histidine kinase [Candidatus Glassbacteria bacterium]|nr:HAMP domain-containing histidine kinase [Candidatus Glassbacteria bacterium]